MSTSLTDAHLKAITDALRAGNKIAAIKLHREATGMGLKESKEEVEAIEAGLRGKFPDQFPAKAQGKGCLALVAVLLLVGLAVSGRWLVG